ncbi:ribonuclease M5 [Lactiplantibacillus mudanjiangensis]|uniref:Ribonuclease M5 n=1 Tax=Lactiplantibacillus mudanjiangensis TaxID=1296538 RepID=A0A660E061_9LACO|nr:ribonuclease M5 [Lactiplantibacillus mudanjiangensis]VDG21407.1 ribonuclease M5 [Lactobacillus sp.] [Lactiplantibacillus mudanjiangensis]VDG26089.1 ribonuclease M5 [Lactobacillus sp.] [Lactiplantibacillus mudanjiangensis]VDG29073.1 ribonuclease M5 [Lactobacillus sp.] [Lactiplantibacillus mudanjiangensis]VDG31590.1 ribonuclease M5 [Lactobacillus sp.] [Lactiplantibacillus mudanjiangensis]
MKKIKEVIVVEGKDDTKRLALAVNADTIETNGSAISDQTLAQIKRLQASRGVIVFTDPDYSGERIRKTISKNVPGVQHAFLPRDAGVPTKAGGSLGVEHASPAAIQAALANLYTENPATAPELISRADLIKAGLLAGPAARKRREQLGELLKIGYVNGKQLPKRLQLFQIQPADFWQAVDQLTTEE